MVETVRLDVKICYMDDAVEKYENVLLKTFDSNIRIALSNGDNLIVPFTNLKYILTSRRK